MPQQRGSPRYATIDLEKDHTLDDLLAWVAPIATIIAAMMTAANLGARVTGSGFAVFTVGSLCWTSIGYTSDQPNLIVTNAFLTAVNIVGIWRWLGRQRNYEDGGKSAARASRRSASQSLFTATGVAGMPVEDQGGAPVGVAVEALIECASGKLSYVVIADRTAGVLHETLRAASREDLTIGPDKLTLAIPQSAFATLAPLERGAWPAAVSHAELRS